MKRWICSNGYCYSGWITICGPVKTTDEGCLRRLQATLGMMHDGKENGPTRRAKTITMKTTCVTKRNRRRPFSARACPPYWHQRVASSQSVTSPSLVEQVASSFSIDDSVMIVLTHRLECRRFRSGRERSGMTCHDSFRLFGDRGSRTPGLALLLCPRANARSDGGDFTLANEHLAKDSRQHWSQSTSASSPQRVKMLRTNSPQYKPKTIIRLFHTAV